MLFMSEGVWACVCVSGCVHVCCDNKVQVVKSLI